MSKTLEIRMLQIEEELAKKWLIEELEQQRLWYKIITGEIPMPPFPPIRIPISFRREPQ